MAAYNFENLSPSDFELLVRDLLQEELHVRLESFTSGKDNGIDLRHISKDNKGQIVVQCKHHPQSTYNQLLSLLKTQELPKVSKLKPNRYIIATSAKLTPHRKSEIALLFDGYCQSENDVFGQDDLNGLLVNYPDIEQKNFKLWLTSKAVLDKIIHSKILNASELEIQSILEDSRLYVRNKSFFKARDTLDSWHYCVIAGIPGIGKSMLARMLFAYYIAHGYKGIKLSGDIREALSVFQTSERQVFYYDDFLGQTSLGPMLHKNEEDALLLIIDRVSKTPNKRLILTTREYILGQAKAAYEKLERSNFDLHKCAIDISSYTVRERARILYNHIYFSDLPNDYKCAVLENGNHRNILKHRNYNPRLIESMTSIALRECSSSTDYASCFMKTLENPEELFGIPFRKHLTEEARDFLLVLATMPMGTSIDDMHKAYQSYRIFRNKKCDSSLLSDTLRELDGNFIRIGQDDARVVVNFYNPAVRDLVEKYLLENIEDVLILCESAAFFEQCIILWGGSENSKFRNYLVKQPLAIIKGLYNTFEAEQCSNLLLAPRPVGHIRRYKYGFDWEFRLLSVVKIADIIGFPERHEMVRTLTDIAIANLEPSETDSDSLFSVLIELKQTELGRTVLSNETLTALKPVFLMDLDSFYDYSNLCGFAEAFPEIISTEELEYITSDFNNWWEDEVDDFPNLYDCSSSEVPDYSNNLEHIGNWLNVDVSSGIEALKSLSEEMAQTENRQDDDDSWRDTYEEERKIEEADIDSLFDELINDIKEYEP